MNGLRLKILLLLFFLVTAFSANWSVRLQQSFPDSDENFHRPLLLQFLPERLRSFIAGYLWTRAESLMHRGPVQFQNEKFIAGSYAGNTDIVPLLKAVIALVPEELVPYQMLASNFSKYLGKPEEGLRIIQEGINRNRQHPGIHELYGAAAFLQFFSWDSTDEKRKLSVLKYLDRATEFWNEESERYSTDPAFKPQNYAFLKARVLVELGKPQEAMVAWQASELDLDNAPDKLAEILRAYRDTGRIPTGSDFPSIASATEGTENFTVNEKSEKKAAALPFAAVVRLLLGAGLLLFVSTVFNRLLVRG